MQGPELSLTKAQIFQALASEVEVNGEIVAALIAGSTYGVAKGARVVGVRVLDARGSGTIAGVMAAVGGIAATPNTGQR